MNKIEENWLKKKAAKGERADERSPNERRKIKLEPGIIPKAEGSAAVELGLTKVIAGVKLEVGEPYPDEPEKGVLITSAELSPLASPEFEPGPPGKKALELARVVDRGIREAELVKLKELSIEPREKVWIIFLDLYVLNQQGNLFDSCGLAALAALRSSAMPNLRKDGSVDHESLKGKIPQRKVLPIPSTIVKVEDNLFLDPSLQEEKLSSCLLTIARSEKTIHGVQKSGSGTLSSKEIERCLELGKKDWKSLMKKFK